jgi:hypothetical protein
VADAINKLAMLTVAPIEVQVLETAVNLARHAARSVWQPR